MRDLSDIDIVVLTYKRDDLLRDCLDSLYRTCGGEPHVIVVDNSPSPATRELVAGYAGAFYLESHGDPGFAGGNNRAIPLCTRPYTLLLNNDTVVHARASIEELASFLDSHPSCSAAQGTMRIGHLGNRLGGCGSWLTGLGVLYTDGWLVDDCPAARTAHRCFAVSGAFFLFRRPILESAGGFLFHDRFHSYYEEVDFCHRIWLAGGEVWYVPTEPIDHITGATFSMASRPLVLRRYYRNILFSLNTCLGPWSRFWIVPRVKALVFGQAIVNRLRGNRDAAEAGFGALRDAREARSDIREMRRRVQACRRVSDRALFRIVRKRMPVGYFLRSVRS
jgi:hypothetical protein